MGLNLKTIAEQWPALAIAVVGVVLVKAFVTAALLRFSGAARRGTAAEVGLLMASPSETTLIVLTTALQAQLISRATAEFRSEEHTSELQSLMRISYAVFCLKTNKTTSAN